MKAVANYCQACLITRQMVYNEHMYGLIIVLCTFVVGIICATVMLFNDLT
jgi:hypothetical protein